MANILVTGATGTVGQIVVSLLLKRGHNVIALVRAKNGENPQDRIRNKRPGHERLTVVAGDILKPFAGVSMQDIARLHGKVHVLMHGAASIKFIETSDQLIRRTNVEGTCNVLNLASALRVPQFHYVSTAYVCGDAPHFTEKDLPMGPHTHRNPYERSKAAAEMLVRQLKIPFSIYRLSIVTGDTSTGYTPDFNGYTGWFGPWYTAGLRIRSEWEKNPSKLIEAGISVDGQGIIFMPVAIEATATGPLNLVPGDWVGEMLAGLIEIPSANETFHITHPNPPTVKYVIEESLKHLGMRGAQLGNGPNPPNRLGAIQKIIRAQIEQFRPYTNKDVERFSDSNTRRVLRNRWRPPPSITPEYLGLILNYAVSRNFGREREPAAVGRT